MFELRKYPRYPTLARARMDAAPGMEGVLKDLSITGCRLEFNSTIDINEGQSCRLRIIPEPSAKIGTFEIEAENRWYRVDSDSIEIGFSIVGSPKGKDFMRYVDYLAWRST